MIILWGSGGRAAAIRRGIIHRARLKLIPGRVWAGGARGWRRRRAPLPSRASGARRAFARLRRRACIRLTLRARLPAHRNAAGAPRAAATARQVLVKLCRLPHPKPHLFPPTDDMNH